MKGRSLDDPSLVKSGAEFGHALYWDSPPAREVATWVAVRSHLPCELIAARTGIANEDAEKRIDDTVAQIKATKEKAKRAADAAR